MRKAGGNNERKFRESDMGSLAGGRQSLELAAKSFSI
jgi:hypothetical protein